MLAIIMPLVKENDTCWVNKRQSLKRYEKDILHYWITAVIKLCDPSICRFLLQSSIINARQDEMKKEVGEAFV